MSRLAQLLAAAACAGTAAAPATAQYQYPGQQYPQQPYQQPYEQYPQQPYQQYPQQGYPQEGYGYDQTYNQNAIGAIIDGLIGNRYNVSDRQAVHQCAYAAVQRSQNYAGGYRGPYGGYNNGYRGYMRVTAITDVQRRSNSVRVRGTLGGGWRGGYGNPPYGGPGYGGPGYGGPGYANGYGYGRHDVSFRCDVDYRGYVRDVRLEPLMRAY